jgi:hypothetical protein
VCGKKEEACLTKAVIVDVDGWQKEESRQPTLVVADTWKRRHRLGPK